MYRLEKFSLPQSSTEQFWDNKYALESISEPVAAEFSRQHFWPLLQSHLKQGERYLDAGCGQGGWLLYLKTLGHHVAGIDIAPKTIASLKTYDSTLELKVGSISQIAYPDEHFAGVIALGTLEYVDGAVPQALREVHRVLKPNGFFFIEVPILNSLRRWLYRPLKYVGAVIKRSQGKRATFANYLFTRREMTKLLHDAGFTITAVQPHELPEADRHYGLYIDWPFLRGGDHYQLNGLGVFIKAVANWLSPWIASTGMIVVARKPHA
ncbi:MAG: class I SAM-dependent methyltransferase [Candidatus Andersenbacteria bacterium]